MVREIPCVEATPTRPRSSSNNCRDLGVKRQSLSRAWSFRRTAAPAGRWLYLGTNCLARRFTSSVAKTRPGEGDDEFFMWVSIVLKEYFNSALAGKQPGPERDREIWAALRCGRRLRPPGAMRHPAKAHKA